MCAASAGPGGDPGGGGYFGQAGPRALLSGNCLINNTLMQRVQEPLTALR